MKTTRKPRSKVQVKECTTATDEVRVFGREVSRLTFSGKHIDYGIPQLNTGPDEMMFNDLPDISNVQLMKSALLKSLDDYDDVALLLSGGKDSRMLACLLKELRKKVHCYTYNLRYSKYENNEVKVAEKVAKKLGFQHTVIPLDFNSYYNSDMIQEIMKYTDGTPLFHTLFTMFHVRPFIKEKYLITGDLVTEYLDTLEYRPQFDGQDIRRTLYNRERFIKTKQNDNDVQIRLHELYFDTKDINKLIILLKTDRIRRVQIYKKKRFNVIHPALDLDVLRYLFVLPLGEKIDGRLARRIIKQTNVSLYKFRTTRSPFSLRWPLSFHIGYGKIFGTGVNNTPIPGVYNNAVSIVENKYEKYRLDNYMWWRHVNGIT